MITHCNKMYIKIKKRERSFIMINNILKNVNIMKKIIFLFCLFLIVGINSSNVNATNKLTPYYNIIDSINEKYDEDFYILSKKEFNDSPMYSNFNGDYSLYLDNIAATDLKKFEQECLKIVKIEDVINVSIYSNTRSTLAKKTVLFYNGNNSMTLTYKHNGSKFDTSYNPKVAVTQNNKRNYFLMSSYTGSFKNSNTTYSVIAKGKTYSAQGVIANKTFTVNFNL